MTAVSRPDRRSQPYYKRELLRLDRFSSPAGPAPIELSLDAITVIDVLFQPRESSLLFRAGASAEHVENMARVVTQDRPLAPLVVASFGSSWVMLDGHHRYQAYLEADHRKAVPVKVAESALRGPDRVKWAVTLSIELNSRDKLSMSARDKMEAAWRLTVLDAGSKKEIRDSTNTSGSSIANMRRTREFLLSRGIKSARLAGMTWRDAKWERSRFENGATDEARPEAYDARLKALISGLGAHVGERAPPLQLVKDALEEVRPGIIRDLLRLVAEEDAEALAEAALARELGV